MIRGNDLVRALDGDVELPELPDVIRVSPPPDRWADLKPTVMAWIASDRTRRQRHAFEQYPLCAIGREWRQLPVARPRDPAFLPECARCSLRSECSPPERWSEELAPFGPRDPARLFRAFLARFESTVGAAFPRAPALVAACLGAFRGPLENNPATVEPSVLVDAAMRPILRTVVFQGQLPEDDRDRRAAREVLLDALVDLHEAAGTAPSRPLIDELRDLPPTPMPMGFELAPDVVRLKAYLRVEHLGPPERAAVLDAIGRHVDGLERAVDHDALDMIGLGFEEGALVSIKVYVRADPLEPYAAFDLAAVPGDSPLATSSGARAYAVGDLRHPTRRPAKWDFSLRPQLLPAKLLSRAMPNLLTERAARELGAVFADGGGFRTDVVAAGFRDGLLAFYVELS